MMNRNVPYESKFDEFLQHMDQEIFTKSKIEKCVMFYSVEYNKNTQAHTTKLQANES